jgi:hypothetical protein
MRKLTTLVAIALYSITLSANAQNLATPFLDLKFESRTLRVESARGLLRQIQYVEEILPTQRVAEKEWIDAELAALGKLKNQADPTAFNNRALALSTAVERAHKRFSEQLVNIRRSLECVIRENKEIRLEVLCWAVAAAALNESIEIETDVTSLRRSGRLPKQHLFYVGQPVSDESKEVAIMYARASKQIIENIVIGYLNKVIR